MTDEAEHKGAGHRQRLRDRFLGSGLDGFHDYEVIELLLTIGTPRKDCKDTAKSALARFKSLQGVFEAPIDDLMQVNGIGPKNAFGIKLIKAAADRYLKTSLIQQDPISDSRVLFDFLKHTLRDKQREIFQTVFLNAKNRVLATETLAEGSLTTSSVYPREVIQAALRHHAAALIFAHNHPSGDPHPSAEDIALTRHLVWASRMVDISVHEHLIIGADGYFSFADHGYMARFNQDFDRIIKQP
jgi:DNA repair protein RadC